MRLSVTVLMAVFTIATASAFAPPPDGQSDRAERSNTSVAGSRTFNMSVTAEGGKGRSVKLTCSRASAGGTHPKAAEACALLAKVNGDIAQLPSGRTANCPRNFEPVSVTARSVWANGHIWFDASYNNKCELRAATGPLFDF
ncbi:SSI family serine proteinase inhibitor [Acrocarpospora catenulata]|uniref:SSI family serine proteinase inhibitor n=1 Tax=Acrocarpospora catenulata TaxID=2836182 RepID=UPI001BD92352|nr:SSI family serine proteinase inhibitor [Acrocarpospora catenulata]